MPFTHFTYKLHPTNRNSTMATLRANPSAPILPRNLHPSRKHFPSAQHRIPWPTTISLARFPVPCLLRIQDSPKNACLPTIHRDGSKNARRQARWRGRRRPVSCLPTSEEKEEVGAVGEGGHGEGGEQYLVRGFGWGVRRMGKVGEELRRVAQVQAEAFHVPIPLFNDFFFEFFKAEVLAALIYKVRNSPRDRYACLVAEDANASGPFQAPFERIVGAVDCTVQNEGDVLKHLDGSEYIYVSGIAVLPAFRRQKIATVLLQACEALSQQWRHRFLALRAYEEDQGARSLYSKAGYTLVDTDPVWVTWLGRKRRVLMIKRVPFYDQAE